VKYTNKCPECGSKEWLFFTEKPGFWKIQGISWYCPPTIQLTNNALEYIRQDESGNFDICTECELVVS
jgi:hypothetical protein